MGNKVEYIVTLLNEPSEEAQKILHQFVLEKILQIAAKQSIGTTKKNNPAP